MTTRANFNDSALVQLYQDLATFLGEFWPNYPNDGPVTAFGARERWKQTQGTGGANKIVVVPGTLDGEDGDPVGVVGPGSFEENSPTARGLFTQPKTLTFCLWAMNTDSPDSATDELAQQGAIEQMQEFVYRATKASSAGGANLVWAKHRYNRKPEEIRFGTEYQMQCAVDCTFFDITTVVVVPKYATVNKNPAS
jgi:hypothetical protein